MGTDLMFFFVDQFGRATTRMNTTGIIFLDFIQLIIGRGWYRNACERLSASQVILPRQCQHSLVRRHALEFNVFVCRV